MDSSIQQESAVANCVMERCGEDELLGALVQP